MRLKCSAEADDGLPHRSYKVLFPSNHTQIVVYYLVQKHCPSRIIFVYIHLDIAVLQGLLAVAALGSLFSPSSYGNSASTLARSLTHLSSPFVPDPFANLEAK